MIVIRPIESGDIPLLRDTSYDSLDPVSLTEMIKESGNRRHSGRYFELLVVESDGVCVGFLNLYGLSETEISIGPEIRRQFRRQGFAGAAEPLALEYAKHLGFTRAVAQVREENAASRALHEKLGFALERMETNAKGKRVCRYSRCL